MTTVGVADAFLDILDGENVRTVFGIPGGPVLGLIEAFTKHPRIRFVLTKHEQAAAYSAFANARATGSLGVCLSTLGPGATNLLAGLPTALIESVPLLAITGQTQIDGFGRGAHQETSGLNGTPDQQAMFRATCKASVMCVQPETLPDLLRNCIRIALSGRPGPVHLSIPSGLLHHSIPYKRAEPHHYRLVDCRAVDHFASVRIAGRLASARAPVILLGGRALTAGCGAQAEALAEATGSALVCDLSSKSVVDERHRLYLGCIGVLGHKAAETFVKQTADLVLAVGQTFDEISTLSWDPKFHSGRDIIQLDVTGEDIGKAFPVADASAGDLGSLLLEIHDALPSLDTALIRRRELKVVEIVRRMPLFVDEGTHSSRVPMPPQRIIAELRAHLPDDALILSDSSKWVRWLGRYFPAARGQIISAHDYEPMGWAVAGAVGVKFAKPDYPVVCICGDGAFLMSAMELSTACNYGLKILWVVMNDSRYGIIHDLQKTLFNGCVDASTYATPDLVDFAASMGLQGYRVSSPEQLSEALDRALSADRSSLLEVLFDVDEMPPLRPRSLMIPRGMGLPDPKPGPETTRVLFKLLKEK